MNAKCWKFYAVVLAFMYLSAVKEAGAVQAPNIEWERSYGGSDTDWSRAIQQTKDGGYIVVGSSRSNDGDVTENHGGYDFWAVKLNFKGDIIWQKSLGDSENENAYAVQQTTDGGFIVAGFTHYREGDGLVIKLDSNGEIEWQKIYGGHERDSINDIRQTTDGGYIFTGYSRSYSLNDYVSGNHGEADCWVVKLDSKGAILWQRVLGGSKHDEGNAVRQTKDGGYIISAYAASSDGDVFVNHGARYFWLIKLDTTGKTIWQKTFGYPSNGIATSIQQASDEGYVVAGYTASNYWIIKLDVEGNLLWQRVLGGTGTDWINSVDQTKDGGYITAGQSDSKNGDVSGNHGSFDYWVVKLNAEGDLVWQKSLGGSWGERAYSIQQTSDGGYIIAGDSNSGDGDVSGNHGDLDFWVVKLKSE